MQTTFPDHDQGAIGWRGFFLVGLRKSPSDAVTTERAGTAILKRTYDIDPQTGELTPAEEPLAIFMKDLPDNLARNGGFARLDVNGGPEDWEAESQGVGVERILDPDHQDPDNYLLKISGAANGEVTQLIDFGEPLEDREFVVSVAVRAENEPVTIKGLCLKAEGIENAIAIDTGEEIPNRVTLFSKAEKWPSPLNTSPSSMRMILKMSTDEDRAVLYDEVQVYNALRYEHDLASFKPQGDVIVLDYPDLPDAGIAQLQVNGTTWLQRELGPTDRRHLFGWASRTNPPRKEEAGSWDVPITGLPDAFKNLFFNGYRRDAVVYPSGQMPYLFPSAEVAIVFGANQQEYRFTLPGDEVTAVYRYYGGEGPDDSDHWLSHNVPMNIDTLVVEPDKNRCYLVWRGIWPFDDQAESAYRSLFVEASA